MDGSPMVIVGAAGTGCGGDDWPAIRAPSPPATPAATKPATSHFRLLPDCAFNSGVPSLNWRENVPARACSLAAVMRIWKAPGVTFNCRLRTVARPLASLMREVRAQAVGKQSSRSFVREAKADGG